MPRKAKKPFPQPRETNASKKRTANTATKLATLTATAPEALPANNGGVHGKPAKSKQQQGQERTAAILNEQTQEEQERFAAIFALVEKDRKQQVEIAQQEALAAQEAAQAAAQEAQEEAQVETEMPHGLAYSLQQMSLYMQSILATQDAATRIQMNAIIHGIHLSFLPPSNPASPVFSDRNSLSFQNSPNTAASPTATAEATAKLIAEATADAAADDTADTTINSLFSPTHSNTGQPPEDMDTGFTIQQGKKQKKPNVLLIVNRRKKNNKVEPQKKTFLMPLIKR